MVVKAFIHRAISLALFQILKNYCQFRLLQTIKTFVVTEGEIVSLIKAEKRIYDPKPDLQKILKGFFKLKRKTNPSIK